MKIIIATDSFKGCCTSAEAGNAAREAVMDVWPEAEVIVLPVGDGGEGTAEALGNALKGETVTATVSDPLGRPVRASYTILPGGAAVVETAQASGLALLEKSERNPCRTSTYGTGELISDAIMRGCRDILICLGGSATNDAGTGLLQALGYRFRDAAGVELDPCGDNLEKISSIDTSGVIPELGQCRFTAACDVDTVFCGKDGAAYIFAPQKGADREMVEMLDRGLSAFARMTEVCTGIDLTQMKGSGAAGGLGGALAAYIGAELKPGADMVLDALGWEKRLSGCDLIITGEGRMDSQTLKGKLPYTVLSRSYGIPVIGMCGAVSDLEELLDRGFRAIIPVTPQDMPLSEAMKTAVATKNIRKSLGRYLSGDITL